METKVAGGVYRADLNFFFILVRNKLIRAKQAPFSFFKLLCVEFVKQNYICMSHQQHCHCCANTFLLQNLEKGSGTTYLSLGYLSRNRHKKTSALV